LTQATITPGGADRPAPTTIEDLQTALDDIAILHGRVDDKSEVIGIAFAAIAELTARVEKLEAES
jgi:hypothetical protein